MSQSTKKNKFEGFGQCCVCFVVTVLFDVYLMLDSWLSLIIVAFVLRKDSKIPSVTLNDGYIMPVVGYGTYKLKTSIETVVLHALKVFISVAFLLHLTLLFDHN